MKATGKRYRSVAAMLRGILPGKKTEATIRFIKNEQAKDRRRAKKLGITLLELYQRQSRQTQPL